MNMGHARTAGRTETSCCCRHAPCLFTPPSSLLQAHVLNAKCMGTPGAGVSKACLAQTCLRHLHLILGGLAGTTLPSSSGTLRWKRTLHSARTHARTHRAQLPRRNVNDGFSFSSCSGTGFGSYATPGRAITISNACSPSASSGQGLPILHTTVALGRPWEGGSLTWRSIAFEQQRTPAS